MNNAEVGLPNDVALCHELIRQQADSLDKAQRRIEQLEHAMDVLLRQRYGPRSERLDPNQLRLFTDEGDESLPSALDPDVVPEISGKPKRTWKRRGRQTLPEHLPRVPVVIELSEQERACPGCGGLRAHFDDEISEQLDYVRPRFSSANSSAASMRADRVRSMWRSRPSRPSRSTRVWPARVSWPT